MTSPGRVRARRRAQVLDGSGGRRFFAARVRPFFAAGAGGRSVRAIATRRRQAGSLVAAPQPLAAGDEGCGSRGDGVRERDRALVDRDDLDPELGQGGDPVRLDAAADGDAADPGCPGSPRDAEGGLAEGRLGIDPPFAGDHDVGHREPRVESGLLGHEIDPRHELQ